MTESDRITHWLHHLRVLMPPRGVILVGPGACQWAKLLQEWGVPSATLAKADNAQFQHLQLNMTQRDGWRLVNEVVAAQTENVTHHQTNDSSENGLLEPERLRGIWPNIQTCQKQTHQTITLNELQQDVAPFANWLMMDCLPALPIIQGAADQLDTFDIIVVRILLDDEMLPTCMASQCELNSYLSSHGFRCVSAEPGPHPAIGHALFVRDSKRMISNLRQQQIEQLTHAKAVADKLAAEHATELGTLKEQHSRSLAEKDKALTEVKQQAEHLSQEKMVLVKERDKHAKLAEERKAHIEQLMQAKAATDKLATEHAVELEALKQQHNQPQDEKHLINIQAEKAGWAKEKADLMQARGKAERLASERQAQVSALEQRLKQMQVNSAETETRQRHMQDELIKAEAQINLIKELILGERGL